MRSVFSKSAFKNDLETSIVFLAKELVSWNSLLKGLRYQVAVNDSRCLWLRPDIIAERVAREGGSTRSVYLEV